MGGWIFRVKSVLTTAMRSCYLILLLALLLPFGSVESLPLHFTATVSFCLTALSIAILGFGTANKASVAICGAVAAFLALWIFLQASSLPFDTFANNIWSTAARYYGSNFSAISVAPQDTMQGLVAVVLPFSVFLCGLVLFSGDQQAEKLLRAIAIVGGAIAGFGLTQFLLFPDTLLLDRKRLYTDSLTAVFVNRNTAATYLGMTTILGVALAFSHLQNAGLASLLRFALGDRSSTRRHDALMILFYGICTMLSLSALLLTKSRAGLGATMLGLLPVVMLLAYHGGQRADMAHGRGFSIVRTAKMTKVARALLAALVLLGFGLLLSGRALLRAEVRGIEDGRICITPGLLRLTNDNWLTGTGLGTFRMVFPAYREPACGLTGTWERAHNFYLEGLITLGLPFVVAALPVLLTLFWILHTGIKSRRRYRWAPVAGLGILLLQITHGIFDFSLQIPAVAAVFSAILAGCVTLSSSGQRRRKSPNAGVQASSASSVPIGSS